MSYYLPTNVSIRVPAFVLNESSVAYWARKLKDESDRLGLRSSDDFNSICKLAIRLPQELHSGGARWEYVALQSFSRLAALQNSSSNFILAGCSMQFGIRDKDAANAHVPQDRLKDPYHLGFTLESLIHSSINLRLEHSTISGPCLLDDFDLEETRYGETPPSLVSSFGLKAALRDYRLVKELVQALGAEECWGAEHDSNQTQSGLCEYYVGGLMAFYFRKDGPQVVIAGLEDNVIPTEEMLNMGSAAGHSGWTSLHRIVDLPWEEYWSLVKSGAPVPQRLLTDKDMTILSQERGLRFAKANELSRSWIAGECDFHSGFKTLD